MQTDSQPSVERRGRPLVKICGLTRPDEALACASLGADAIGLVFYPKSPRHLTTQQAGDICRQLPAHVNAVAVCVDMPSEEILALASECGFGSVQLHGRETPQKVARLTQAGLRVIKALFTNRAPEIALAPKYEAAAAFLVECGQGRLPGGNARTWNWSLPPALFKKQPVILAGGLAPANIRQALQISQADAVDVSSGVEASPGRKDPEKVRMFLEAVKGGPEYSAAPHKRSFKQVF
ncbi:MAG: phosphoribosylanthranilate isomerase [Desulfobacterales bacterium]|nr:phosphoribosylanthranilate isomerase [Desulfobacterales bacterium]